MVIQINFFIKFFPIFSHSEKVTISFFFLFLLENWGIFITFCENVVMYTDNWLDFKFEC